MTLHKEGTATLLIAFILLAPLAIGGFYFMPVFWLSVSLALLAVGLFLFLMWFFRKPQRIAEADDSAIYAPADGKVVVIEEVFEKEVLKQNCLQVSIFMSPLNVHINWYPVKGSINYYQYHPGKKLVAWHPKSSEENERTTVGIQFQNGKNMVMRQVAGALARRIVCYAPKHKDIAQGQELGFIKFGSRVDLYLPLETKVNVKIGDAVSGNITKIATI